ncbi:MAG: cytochrome P450 [Acidimicrobiales bacterium]
MPDADAAVFFNPLQEGFAEDPWRHLAEMRRADPVHPLVIGGWSLFRYDDVFAVLRDPTLSVDDANADFGDLARGEFLEGLDDLDDNSSILGLDPPDHTRLRRLVSKAFTPRTIEALRPRVQALVDATLDEMAAAGTADVVAELAFPLPFEVISEMLGMPASDRDQIRDWSGAIVKTLDPILTDDELRDAHHAAIEMNRLLAGVIEWKRANPGDDLLTALIDAEEDGDRLTTKELRDQVSLLFIAGHETTVNLIGTGIWELLRHPEQTEELRADPNLDAGAVEELLRFVSPVQFSRRIAVTSMELRKQIPSAGVHPDVARVGQPRPRKFGDTADDLDLRQAGAAQHVAFGSGIHYCLGSSLAKLEAQVAIGGFVRRFPERRSSRHHMERADEPAGSGAIGGRPTLSVRVCRAQEHPMARLRYEQSELLADHEYAAPHVVMGTRLHGGMLADGTYQPPGLGARAGLRRLGDGPAGAWRSAVRRVGVAARRAPHAERRAAAGAVAPRSRRVVLEHVDHHREDRGARAAPRRDRVPRPPGRGGRRHLRHGDRPSVEGLLLAHGLDEGAFRGGHRWSRRDVVRGPRSGLRGRPLSRHRAAGEHRPSRRRHPIRAGDRARDRGARLVPGQPPDHRVPGRARVRRHPDRAPLTRGLHRSTGGRRARGRDRRADPHRRGDPRPVAQPLSRGDARCGSERSTGAR